MAISQPPVSPATSSITAQAVQRGQRSALAMLAFTLAIMALLAIQLWRSPYWQLWVVLACLATYAILTGVAWRQFGKGHQERGGWILIAGMYLVFPLGAALTVGTGLTYALTLFTLTILLAPRTLPPTSAGRAVVVSLVLSIVTLFLGLVDIPWRVQGAYANTVLPFVALGLIIVLVVGTIRGFSSFSLRTKLIIISLAVSLVPLGIVGVVFVINAQQNAMAAANQALQAAAQKTAAGLDEFIQSNLNEIRVAAQIPEFQSVLNLGANDPGYAEAAARAEAVMRALRRRDPIFVSSYALLDQNGVTVLDTYRPDIGTSKADRDYFIHPLADNLPYVSHIRYSPSTGRASIYFSSPVRNSRGDVQGVFRARFDAAVLQEQIFLNNGLAGSESGGILLDENNVKLADGLQPDTLFKIIGQPTLDQVTTLKNQQRLPDLPLEDLVINSPEFERGLANATRQPTFEVELEDDQDKEQVAISPLSSQLWKVVFSRTQTEFLAPLNQQNRWIILGGLLSVLVVAGVAILAAQTIARPVTALTATAEKVRQGDLSARATVTTQDEVGTLATAFNDMTAQLREVVTSLEDRVAARTDQLRVSAEVGRAATSILNSDQLLEQVVGLITARFNFYYAAVFLLETPDKAVLRAATGEAGRTLLERHHSLPVTNESMVGTAIITQRARIALDVGEGAVRFANPLLPNTRSEIALPLRVGERVLGALNVQSEDAGAFDEANAEVLQVMADQIAVAVFNAETFDRSEKQARTLARLNQLSRDLAQATTREGVAFSVAQAVTDLIGPSRMALIETTPNPQLLSARTLWPEASRPLGDPQPVPIGKSFSGECLKRGTLVYFPDLSTVVDKYEDAAMVYALGVRASVAFPLRIGERVIGAFNVASDSLNAYSTEQLSQLEQVAAQVALALDSLNLTRQTQQALAELDAANRRLVGQAWSTYTQSGGLVAAEWRNGEWSTARVLESQAAGTSAQALVPVLQAINLPIKVRGETIGEFNVLSDIEQSDWTADDVAFAQSLIDQVGQVLENARLLEETEHLAQREQIIRQITTRIRAAGDVQAVLQATTTELARSLGVSRAIMRLAVDTPTDRLTANKPPAAPKPARQPKVEG